MSEFLRREGWLVADDYRQADLIIFNACGATFDSERLSLGIMKELQVSKRPDAELIVCGCLPRILRESFTKLYQGSTFGSDEIEQLGQIVGAETDSRKVTANSLAPCTQDLRAGRWRISDLRKLTDFTGIVDWLIFIYLRAYGEAINVFRSHTYCIKASTGCLNACTYCAIRLSRGAVRSAPAEDVVEQVKNGLRKGYSEFALIGTDLGAYGRDRESDLASLLYEIASLDGEYTIRLRNIQPRFLIEMMPDFRKVFKSGKIAYVSSAAESGSDRILRSMKRGYCIEDFKEAIRTLNREFPGIQIRTRLMAGFPGETEEDFSETVRLLDELCFDYVEVYAFQPRPNTKAATMHDQVSLHLAKKRARRLLLKSLFSQRGRRKRALKEYRVLRKQNQG
jgi:tRNA A37 methylthiotransferase MiaB